MQPTTITTTPPAAREQICPQCHATIPVDPRYVTWCDRCNWNVQPRAQPAPRDLFDKIGAGMGKRFGQGAADEVARAPLRTRALTLRGVLIWILAGLIHGVTLACAALGVWLIVGEWAHAPLVILGMACLALAWLLRPRFPPAPKFEEIAQRTECPALYRAADRVAEALGTRPIDMLVIAEHFNAGFGQVGWRRKRVLWVGLPLWEILDDMPERELERRHRASQLASTRLDLSHPPTATRMALLAARPCPRRLTLGPHEAGEIEREMAAARPEMQKRIVALVRRNLYY